MKYGDIMRIELEKRINIGAKKKELTRKTYRGTFCRTGKKHGTHGHGATILLTNIHQKGSNIELTDHIWLNYTKEFAKLDEMLPGDIIEFNCAIDTYRHIKPSVKQKMNTDKSFVPNKETDYYDEYRLIRPTRAKICKKIRTPKGYTRHETKWMIDFDNFETRINKFAKYQTVKQLDLFKDKGNAK